MFKTQIGTATSGIKVIVKHPSQIEQTESGCYGIKAIAFNDIDLTSPVAPWAKLVFNRPVITMSELAMLRNLANVPDCN